MITDNLQNAYRSERLVFRAVENTDADKAFLHSVQNDPMNIALADYAMIQPRGTKCGQELIDHLLKATMAVIICLSSTDASEQEAAQNEPTPVGFVVLGWGGRPANHVQHRSTSIGIMLHATHQNRGYGGEAINWALDWAFRFGGFHRVSISTVSYNERGLHLYKKLGFVEEGRGRETHWHDRKWYDTIELGMLEHEWEELRKAKS